VLSNVSIQLLFSIGLVAAVAGFLVWDRKNVNRHYILFYRRTKRGLDFIQNLAERYKGFWKLYGSAGAILGIISIPFTLALTAFGVIQSIKASSAGGPSLILPGLVSQTEFNPGVSLVPVEYWVASIAVLMTVHELSHALVAKSEGYDLNSVGWFIMGIIPGAFVEPKGENMLPGEESSETETSEGGMWDQGNWKSRLKVVSAGSFANYLTAALFIVISIGFTAAATTSSTQGYIGINFGENQSTEDVVYEAQEGYPAAEAGLTSGTVYSINGTSIDTTEDILEISENVESGQNITLNTTEGEYTVETTSRKVSRIRDGLRPYSSGVDWFVSMLYTIGMLNFLIGIFNMLPIKPLDGGHAVESIMEKLEIKNRESIMAKASAGGWFLLIGSFALSLI
jgi:Zn-dependent protease